MKKVLLVTLCLFILAGCGRAVEPPAVDPGATPPVALDLDSDRFFEANRPLFDYDSSAPLDVVEVSRQRSAGVTAYDLTYRSPKGGRVPATLLVPDGAGPYPGLVVMHGLPANRQAVRPLGSLLAQAGAVVILIDAPFARPENRGREALTLTTQDREEQIQLIVDLRRAVDLLLTRPEVDAGRLAYFGVSYGGAMGGLLAGVEDRLGAYVLVVGDGGLVSHLTGAEDWPGGDLFRLSESRRQAWLEAMWPIEPLHYVGHAAPAFLLFLNGTQDALVAPADAVRYQAAGSEPKTVHWYEAGHGLPPVAFEEAVGWLEGAWGTPLIGRLLLAWLVLAGLSLAYLLWDLVHNRPATWVTALAWALTGLFFGPLALLVYLLLSRREGLAVVQQALGSTLWGAGRYLAGGILALAILLEMPAVVRDNMAVRLPLILLLPLASGLLFYACTGWAARGGRARWLWSRRPLGSEALAAITFLVGAYAVVIWLGESWIATWYPFGADLSNPAQWIVLILAAWAGAVTAYPAHLWLIGRGLVRWGPRANLPESVRTVGSHAFREVPVQSRVKGTVDETVR
ncbi:MAG: acetylxylan esterase [Anaerolineae bacterium]|jgi:dienelactone hydrolase